MNEIVSIMLIAIGLPALGLTIIFTTLILKNWWVKSKELKIKEEQMRLDAKNKQDQTNQQIIESHSHSISTREFEGILNEIRELKDELIRVKADATAARGRSTIDESQLEHQGESNRRMHDKNA